MEGNGVWNLANMFQKSEEQSNGTTRQIISVLITDETDEVIGGFWHSAQSSQTGEQNFNFGLFFFIFYYHVMVK